MRVILALLLATAAVMAAANSHGFNDKIAWASDLESGLAAARAENKPAMLLIYSSGCGACQVSAALSRCAARSCANERSFLACRT